MLEVVEEQQQTLVGDLVGQTLLGAERLARRLKHQPRVAQRRERHPEDPVRVAPRGFGGHLKPEARLAGAARARQRQQSYVVLRQQLENLRELMLAADEGRGRNGEVGPVEALQRRELVVAELVDPLGRRQVLQPVLAQVSQPLGAHEARRGLGHEHLATVSGRRNARRPVHVDSDISLPAQQRRPGVDPNTNPNRATSQALYRGRRGGDCTGGRREGNEESIPLRVDLHPTVRSERRAQDPSMVPESLRISIGTKPVE